jgi:putative membrane protein
VIIVMWGYDGWGWGPWLGMGFGMILFWGAVIAATIVLVRYLAGARDRGVSGGQGSAEQILAERFARGEINEDEYRQRRELLRGSR